MRINPSRKASRAVCAPLVGISFSLLILTTSFFAQTARAGEVESFSPQGLVKTARQVRAKFSTAMLPFGDPRSHVDPFDIKCPEKFTTRWADAKNWIADFVRDVPPGVSCEFTLKNELKDLAGDELTGERRFKFSTGGPAIVDMSPGTWSDVQNDQAFVLTLDGPADEASVERSVFLSVKGIGERIGIRILRSKDREEILKVALSPSERTPERLKRTLVIQPVRTLPDGAEATIHWEQGVLSVEGMPVRDPQTYTYNVRPSFEARFNCTRENANAACNPVVGLELNFTAPIAIEDAKKIALTLQDKKTRAPHGLDELLKQGDKTVSHLRFEGPFPERQEFTLALPQGLRDETGRSLVNAAQFPLKVRTAPYAPLVKFPASFGILELKGNPVLPLHVRNIEEKVATQAMSFDGRTVSIGSNDNQVAKIIEWLGKVREKEHDWEARNKALLSPQSGSALFSIKKPNGGRAFELMGIPLNKPGFHVVEVASPALGKSLLGGNSKMFVATSALVTDLSVHLKWARENSLVWVTELATGKPVAGAQISLRACNGTELAKGLTGDNGVLIVKELAMPGAAPDCSGSSFSRGLFAFAKKGEDLSFVYSGWNEGLETYRFQVPSGRWSGSKWGTTVGHTIFDRMLYRAGETVHMKHVLRDHAMNGFNPSPQARRPVKLILNHEGSGQKEEISLKWDPSSGTAITEWKMPKEAKLGTYTVTFSLKPITKKKDRVDQTPDEEVGVDYDYDTIETGRFRVEEFRIPLMAAVVKVPDQALVRPQSVPVDLSIQYLAGGAAKNLAVRLRHRVNRSEYVFFDDYPGFSFSAGEVVEKKATSSRAERINNEESPLLAQEMKLDQAGGLRTEITQLPQITRPMSLDVELEFSDPSGEVQTVSRRAPLWPSKNLIGIKSEYWLIQNQTLKIDAVVIDPSGKPVAGAPVEFDAFLRTWITHRKRLVGGFYAYEDSEEIKRVATLCKGVTDTSGRFTCETKPPTSGELLIQAKTQDKEGFTNATQTTVHVYAPGEEVWMPQEDSDRIDLLPEIRRYEPGQTARFQVKTPFKEATALITVEREGVIDTLVQPLIRDNPVIQLPIKGNYAPNVFVSAFLVRGRVSDPKPTALVDLAKPAFKMGLTEIKVGWKAHELNVQVKPDREVYRVREKAKVSVKVTRADGAAASLPTGSEITLATVDEGLLELQPNTSWDLLSAMMGQRGLDVDTSTAQSQVVGKRHFGLKARPPGGDGGARTSRELFDTLLFWKAKIALNAQGEATVEVPLNDSLTSFRIVVVALGGPQHFGTGSARIRATKDLMLFSGIAPVVREGDQVSSAFTVRNASEKEMRIHFTARVKGLAEQPAPQDLALAPGAAQVIDVPIRVPTGITELEYIVTATAGTDIEDSLKIKSKVVASVPERVLQSTITQIENDFRIDVERPAEAIKGKGGVNLVVQSKLGRGLDGVRRYMRLYPYTCLEQKISRAISLEDKALLKDVFASMPNYLDGEGLFRYFPNSYSEGSETLTAYALSITDASGDAMPEEIRSQVRVALERFVKGEIVRRGLRDDDLVARKLAALEALSYAGPIDPALLQAITITPNVWPTSAVLDWVNILKRSPKIPKRAEHMKTADQILRSRMNFQGSTMVFSTEAKDRLWWLMTSVDLNAVRLLYTVADEPAWREDIPRVVRGALLRQKGGHWDLTTANAWGTLALRQFSTVFEKDTVNGQTEITLENKKEQMKWSPKPDAKGEGKALSLPWPESSKGSLMVTHNGSGKPWLTVQSVAAIPLKAPFSTGYRIKRTLEPIEQKTKGVWSIGDIMRVRLEIDAQADSSWVVVSDPVPAGATILGSGLGRDSRLMDQGTKGFEITWPTFQERGFEVLRSYYSFVSKGPLNLEYTLRLNSAGQMNLPPTLVEAMYTPELFGELPNAPLSIAR